ncbi:type VI secretion system baseplate subunit TssG [Parashewanella spongiae]|nr:type VI secretion system baseplate subunit TssG [Parashewanella spongiae]
MTPSNLEESQVEIVRLSQTLKHIAAKHGDIPNIRFTTELLPAFYHSQIRKIQNKSDAWIVEVSSGALYGNNSVLPHYMQNQIIKLFVELSDESLKDFFDIFNNRYWKQFCNLCTKHSLSMQLEEETFKWNKYKKGISQLLKCLTGFSCNDPVLPSEHLIQYVGLLGPSQINPNCLRKILEDYFNCKFELYSSKLEYQKLTSSSLCKIGISGRKQRLGQELILGKKVPVVGQKLILKICPESYDEYIKTHENSSFVKAVKIIISNYIGTNFKYHLFIKINSKYLSRLQISTNFKHSKKLGHSTWIYDSQEGEHFVEFPLK